MLARVHASCCFLTLQKIADEIALIGRRSFTAPEWKQEHVTVFDEHGSESAGGLFQCELQGGGVQPRTVASAVIEHDGGERASPGRFPEKRFQMEIATRSLDELRCDGLRSLCERRRRDR